MDRKDLLRLVPTFKTDQLGDLEGCTDDELLEIIDELFEWCVDSNWPVANRLSPLLSKLGVRLAPPLRVFLATRDPNDMWHVLACLDSRELDLELLDVWQRLIASPTDEERHEGLDELARWRLNGLGIQ
jgi:Domain of unknown function (DUF5071)